MHSDRTPAAASSLRAIGRTVVASVATLALAACGNTYRPVVSSINPVGPAGQPTKYAIAISSNGPTAQGLVTLVDFSGDTIVNTTLIGVNPQFFQVSSTGFEGYTINGDGTLNSFSISSSLLYSDVLQTTLLANSKPISLYSQGGNTYIAEFGRNALAQLSGLPPALKQELPTGANTVYTVGAGNSPRAYALVQGTNLAANGTVVPIETSSNTVDSPITVGVQPIYGVMTADSRRAFIMNKGSNSVSVINSQTNAPDTFVLNGVNLNTIPVGLAPVWADFAPTFNEILVANAGDSVNPGSVTVANIALCNANVVSTNPNCNPTNPVDAVGFGQVLATIPVGVNPVMIAVLQDGSEAFVANAGNPNLPCNTPTIANPVANCSVSIINLTTNTVIATIPAVASINQADGYVHGRPNWIAVTSGTPTGKAYITAGDSSDISIIRSDNNTIQTHLPLQGNGVAVRVNAP